MDFRRVRFLNPTSARLAYEEGLAWYPIDPDRAIQAWRVALTRPWNSGFDLVSALVGLYRRNPSLRPKVLDISYVNRDFRYALLVEARPAVFNRQIEEDLRYDSRLSAYSDGQRRELLKRWAQTGSGEMLLELLRQHPDIVMHAWELEALALAGSGELRAAVRTVRREIGRPEIPTLEVDTSPVRLEREFRANPRDLLKGATLLKMQIEARLWPQALQTATIMSRSPNCPSYVFYWQGEILFMQEELDRSWSAFSRFLDARREPPGE